MAEIDWESACYETVDWETVVGPDSRLVYRVEEGSWEITFVSTVLAGASGTLAYESIQPWIEQKIEHYRGSSGEDYEHQGEVLKDLFPFVNYADVFIGQRHSGAEQKLVEISDYISNLNRSDTSVYDEDHIEGYSTNELFQTLEFVISTNIALNNEGPQRVLSDTSLTTDFSGDLIAIGGPISNLYTRNLMYSDVIDLPYYYNLNPADGSTNLSSMGPIELRNIGITDDRLEHSPNWSICEGDGTTPKVGNRPARPERRGETWIRDYFMIIKAPNVHPDSEATFGSEPKVLSVSGCHGFGTRAGILALQDENVLETLENEADDGYFQALGRAKRRRGVSVEDSKISVPAEHVRLLKVE